MTESALEEVVDRLYELRPDEFVPARDDAVAAAKDAGDKDLARAVARLRRPTKAAWLANLLARKRGEQLDGRWGELDYVRQVRDAKLERVMSNNFAFGGINTSLVFGSGSRGDDHERERS